MTNKINNYTLIKIKKLKNCTLQKINMIIIFILFTVLTSCHSNYVYLITDNHKEEYAQVADTMGIKVFLYNKMYLEHQRTILAIERDTQIVEFKDIDIYLCFDSLKCFVIDILYISYGESLNNLIFKSSKQRSDIIQNSDYIPDTLRIPNIIYKWFEFEYYYDRNCGYDSDLLKNVSTKIKINLVVNGKDIIIEKNVNFKKFKYNYSRLDGVFYWDNED